MTPAPSASVRVQAPGKINVSLKVGPPRPDGYHSVASIYLAVSLFEEVTATEWDGDGVRVSLSDPDGRVPLEGIPQDADNLAARAARAVAKRAGRSPRVHLHIAKRVPVAGGMGGGSADAAAALVACNELWNAGLSRRELAELAAGLGADVPFSLMGGVAAGLGVGDRLTPVAAAAPLHWVLVPAGYGLSTPKVYAETDRLRADTAVAEPVQADPDVLAAIASGNPGELAGVLANDLQPAALELAPQLEPVLAAGTRLGALAGMVSGSGPTLAFLASDETGAAALAAALRAEGHGALAVHGPAAGAVVLPEAAPESPTYRK
ncbi:4-(cytidine 5'-diphospho)-2-C-methyl-D-erythritol kinase [Arthrobacter zhangbolii]|uniref:4-diphosphocytidyl-2-C-methyl-D-erythritol kinase n=1 Tax=Arthrobacter zhangbolii TaxID=2886936 RepID=A0A9X1M8S8_9MICC|nr:MULTISPECIES: 4-(cytidine 5'-diphospho)-2-C-methyl-D-erythritol kinase [Arthrobacter]MCC3272945.1 4-(cytidine 5'-diphospho)-2-C-methyl-D-erythritol kinase [Arthrobacter zhangbolii]MCC3295281.1 4-(cytidine 5'-diphospho)-2-C-methyl-D-erythritol kinase [Arthrobacter zhangbolii]MDN3905281.1 4-(cytidine 5'-diphospho)-2-C-methyl-D-erythritol kinase [Arthrobacter sp. YD2]UON92996.1 4-(cytidine 5'-diphospho)-2-C-methyl-D-erythritol kinase [Arthrobacter zhangbolii]